MAAFLDSSMYVLCRTLFIYTHICVHTPCISYSAYITVNVDTLCHIQNGWSPPFAFHLGLLNLGARRAFWLSEILRLLRIAGWKNLGALFTTLIIHLPENIAHYFAEPIAKWSCLVKLKEVLINKAPKSVTLPSHRDNMKAMSPIANWSCTEGQQTAALTFRKQGF